ncbi:MAG: hypothetical protein C0511_09240 [Hyphomicrobium sp.]|nr:hypothetical protein [Hyphomicrobium sp.]
MSLTYRTDAAARIVRQLIRGALVKGWSVSVYDGEEWTVKQATSLHIVTAALATTDEDVLRFREADGTKIGDVSLIWSNDEDVISDHTDVPDLRELVDGVLA